MSKSRVRNLVDYKSQTADLDGDETRNLTISGTVIAGAIDSPNTPDVNLTIAPEVLEIQVAAPEASQDIMWKWTWEQSTLPYARRTITNSGELNVPLYKQGTYVVNNFAAYDVYGSMTQTHGLFLKWIKSAGSDNLVSWATSTGPISDTHPSINDGAATDVQRITVNVPTTIIPPSLTPPSVSYTVTNTVSGSYTFSGNASGYNPNLGPFYRGGTYTINITASGHPFYFTTDNGTNFSAGTYFGEYTSGVTGSRNDTGSITFTVPADAPDTLYYQCGNHSAMRGEITVKDLAVETNINGNYVVYFQHTQEGHATPVELRPIPSLVNQMCLVYDTASGKFVPQDLATYVENTPSFENKIREVAGTAELVVADGSAVIAKVTVYDDSTYLPLTGNNAGDQAFATDTDILYIWDGSAWQQAGSSNSDDLTEGSKNLFFTDDRADARIAAATATDLTITGDVTATTVNATTVDLGDWTITEASGSSLFETQGVTKMKLDSSGNLDVVGNINSSAYIYSAAALIVNGKTPPLAFDFVNSYYRNSGNDSTFANSLTFTRASSATMMNSSGQVVTVANGVNRLGHHIYNSTSNSWVNSGILIESEARTNYVLDSHLQTTNNGIGTLGAVRTVFTENDVVSPDGTTNAAKLAGDGSFNTHKAEFYMQGSGTFGLTDTVTWSVYLKQGTHRYAQIFITDNAGNTNGTINNFYVNVDLQDGTILGDLATGAIGTHSRIENVGNGWHRVSATLTKQGDNVRTDGGVQFSNAGAANSNPTITVGADDYFYVWGAQAEVGAAPSSLIPTSGGAATRAAELLTVAAAKMPWPAISDYVETTGTELITNGDFSTSDLSLWTAAAGNTISIVNGRLRVTRDGSINTYGGALTDLDVTLGSYYQITIECISGSISSLHRARNIYSEGYYGNNQPSGTYYFKATSSTLRIDLNSGSGANSGYFEYDNISLKEIDPPTMSIQMSGTMTYADEDLFGSTSHTGAGQATFYRLSAGVIDYIYGGIQTGTTRTGQFRINQRKTGASGSSQVYGTNTDYSPGINVPFKIAARHGATFINGAVEGTALTANTTPTALPDLSSTNLQLGYDYMGTIGKVVVWNEDIGDTGIASASL